MRGNDSSAELRLSEGKYLLPIIPSLIIPSNGTIEWHKVAYQKAIRYRREKASRSSHPLPAQLSYLWHDECISSTNVRECD